jgi:hypothetical protein
MKNYQNLIENTNSDKERLSQRSMSCDFLSYQNCDFMSCDFLSVYQELDPKEKPWIAVKIFQNITILKIFFINTNLSSFIEIVTF